VESRLIPTPAGASPLCCPPVRKLLRSAHRSAGRPQGEESRRAVDRVKLAVVFHEDAWRLQVGERFSRPFNSDREAIQAAIRHAHNLGRQGHEAEIVMKAMTCLYGPNGLVRAVPTPRG
jgi:hypothetical protein